MTRSVRRLFMALAMSAIVVVAALAYALWQTRIHRIAAIATRNDSSTFAANPATAAALAAGREAGRGAELYLDNCAACHRSTGEGSTKVFPEIAGNSLVLSADPSALIRLVLLGSSLPATVASPSALGMPGFGWRLSNTEVAQLLTFIRSSWGNQAPSVSALEVAHTRAAVNAPSSP
jgi:alcohol dehydrogenase (quinone), cytochrome c subunit